MVVQPCMESTHQLLMVPQGHTSWGLPQNRCGRECEATTNFQLQIQTQGGSRDLPGQLITGGLHCWPLLLDLLIWWCCFPLCCCWWHTNTPLQKLRWATSTPSTKSLEGVAMAATLKWEELQTPHLPPWLWRKTIEIQAWLPRKIPP